MIFLLLLFTAPKLEYIPYPNGTICEHLEQRKEFATGTLWKIGAYVDNQYFMILTDRAGMWEGSGSFWIGQNKVGKRTMLVPIMEVDK